MPLAKVKLQIELSHFKVHFDVPLIRDFCNALAD